MTDKTKQPKIGLELLREPFPAHQISKLPKPTKAQNDAVKADYKQGIRCSICGGWHHPDVIHLDYVGHAALTDRLLDCDPKWSWEPFATSQDGLPALDKNGGLWIKLTVCGTTRMGYGHPDNKQGGDAIKEAIGDALRNAAMRFGAALDLWHKGDLHGDSDAITNEDKPKETKPVKKELTPEEQETASRLTTIKDAILNADSVKKIDLIWNNHTDFLMGVKEKSPKTYANIDQIYLDARKKLDEDEIPTTFPSQSLIMAG
jgi:hypothetical protein